LNYSTLKALDTDPENLIAEDKDFSDGLIFGSAVDTLMFDGKKEYDKNFYVLSASKPTASLEVLADAYIEIMQTKNMHSRDVSLALELIKDLKLWSNIKKEETLIAKLTKEFWDYIDAVQEAGDKHVIDPETNEKVSLAVNTLKTHQFTGDYFNEEQEDVDIVTQLALVFEMFGRTMKAMLDMVVVDHENKTVRPCDMKTMGENPKTFPSKIIKWRYDIQAELYTEAIKAWMVENYPGYELLPFRFVVISSQHLEKPYVYEVDPKEFRGKINDHRTVKLRSTEELVQEFEWHSKFQMFSYPREMYENRCIKL
jgi:hypothetical protein